MYYFREGHLCDDCVPLPGCEHGSCNNAFECNCEEEPDVDANGDPMTDGTMRARWEGAFCDKRKCFHAKFTGYTAVSSKPPFDFKTKISLWPGQARPGQAKKEHLFLKSTGGLELPAVSPCRALNKRAVVLPTCRD